MITVKKERAMTEEEAVKEFQKQLTKFKRHLFNIRWQYKAFRDLRESLKDHQCLIHVDFGENYVCKYTNEVQSVHFGGSHQQATLHTGVLYAGAQWPLTFYSISPSRRHDPPAIWAHLDPIVEMVKEKYPKVNRLHFFSDGPATQYRQKGNFLLFFLPNHSKEASMTSVGIFSKQVMAKGHWMVLGGPLVRLGEDIQDAGALFQKLKTNRGCPLQWRGGFQSIFNETRRWRWCTLPQCPTRVSTSDRKSVV